MATTKIWAIKDSLSRVVDYASNPEKTILNNLKQVLLYAENNEKTVTEKEKIMYVTGVNCKAETAYEAYHAYQSFKTGEVSPEQAHKIGVELARKMWGEHQVIVATHFNTGTYHNHFVVCSVNMFTGKKFNCNKGAYYRFRGLSDELCSENNLTVIKNPKGRTPRNIYFAEKRGEPTKYNLMREAIDETLEICVSYAQFKKAMYKKGYIINDDPSRKYATIRSINDKKATRMYQLGEPYKYKGSFKSISKMSGIEMLFVALFYFMGLLPKEKPHYKPLSPEMKQAVRKMESYSNQIRLIAKEKLSTIEDVKSYISQTEKDIVDITNIRQKYRNKLRNCTDNDLISEYKVKRDNCTTLLKDYRKNLKIANQIIEDVPKIKEVVQIEKQTKNEELTQRKEKNKYRDRGGR